MRGTLGIPWMAVGLILIIGAILVVNFKGWPEAVTQETVARPGAPATAESPDGRRKERSELRSRKESGADKRADWLLAVGEGELAMIGVSSDQFDSWFGPLTPTFNPSLPSLVNVYSRKEIEAAIRAALANGDDLKATFSHADQAELARESVAVETAILGVHPAGSDLKVIISADGGVTHTAWTLERDGVLVVRSLSDPGEAILIIGPNL